MTKFEPILFTSSFTCPHGYRESVWYVLYHSKRLNQQTRAHLQNWLEPILAHLIGLFLAAISRLCLIDSVLPQPFARCPFWKVSVFSKHTHETHPYFWVNGWRRNKLTIDTIKFINKNQFNTRHELHCNTTLIKT